MKYVTMNNTLATIKVKGDMTLPIYLELTDDFKEAINNGCTEVIMDFSETNLIDSVGISFIIDIIKNKGDNIKKPNRPIRKSNTRFKF